METHIKYKVYTHNTVMQSEKHLALEEVKFKGWRGKGFDTEEEAIEAIKEEGRTYEEFIILKTVRIYT